MKKAAVVFLPLAVGAVSLHLVSCGKSSPSPTAPTQDQRRDTTAAVPPAATKPRAQVPWVGAACDSLPISQVPDHDCFGQQKDFADAVNRAVDLASANPELVNGTTILRLGLFYFDVIKTLSDAGYCAIWDSGLELQVRNARTPADPHSESYRLDANAQIRRAFRASCDDASFPKEQPDYGMSEGCPAGVSLAASREITCTFNQVQLRPQEKSTFEADVRAAILAVLRERPELFNGEVVQDEKAYGDAVAQKLREGGYCAVPGDELAVKRISDQNRFSEQFRIVVNRNGLSANFQGPYRTTCYPAAF
jgi:hypothetical protein